MSYAQQTAATEFKAIDNAQINVDEAQGIVECFVAGLGNKDSVGDICAPGCFTESLKRRKPRVVWGHNWNEPIGKVLDIYEVGPNDPRLPMKMKRAGIGGLYARVQFNLKSERGKQAFLDVSFFGAEQEWSIGYKTLDADYDSQRQANVLKEVELYEVSPVLHGANQLTGTISIKADEPLRDPKGGLTAAGRRHFNETEGSNLKPGVKGPADTPEKMRRKGSFLTRFFTNPSGPMKDEKGEPTRLALSAAAWGEPVPQNMQDAAALAAKGRRLLERYKNSQNEKGYDVSPNIYDAEDSDSEYSGPRGEDGGVPAANPAMGRMANIAKALAMRFGGAVRLRSADKNMVIFDHRKEGEEPMTMRVSYHFDGDEFMFGEAVRVKPQMVYLPENGTDTTGHEEGENPYEENYDMDDNPMVPEGVKPKFESCKCGCMGGKQSDELHEEIKAPIPPDAVPQERITGDVLRGYGPRRGNLERLLRYWRPIMRREGGFRRCRVILADHPELYPLNNICAWLHHETTGLWPNEGCHHPGMKNCRRKIRGVVNGSIWNDSEWNSRLDKIPNGKSMGLGEGEDDLTTMLPHEIEEKALMHLKEFLDGQPEFVNFIGDDSNWEHFGETDDEDGGRVLVVHIRRNGDDDHGDCGCGCGGSGSCGGQAKPMMGMMRAMSELEKTLKDDFGIKAGRVLNNRNLKKLQDALTMLQEVIQSAGKEDVQVKYDVMTIPVAIDNLFEVKSLLDPVIEYHGIISHVDEDGIHLTGLTSGAEKAINTAVNAYKSPNR
jgi:HK97 family phage prohead protease